MRESERKIFEIDKQTAVVPVVHGSMDFAMEIRRILLSGRWDCLAVPLPPSFQPAVEEGVRGLPIVRVAAAEEPTDPPCWTYVPIDPCQPVIMALRVAAQEYIPAEFIDLETDVFEDDAVPSPDPYALKTVPLEKFCSALIPAHPRPEPGGQTAARIAHMATALRKLTLKYARILCLCQLDHWVWLREAYAWGSGESKADEPSFAPVRLEPVAEKSLIFVLGELPYITYLHEKARRELLPDQNLSVDGVKQLLLETRDEWLRKFEPLTNWAAPQRLDSLIRYIRNLTLMGGRLTPDLYTLVVAAKQVVGDSFAISLVETAKQYPYQHIAEKGAVFGVDQFRFGDGAGGYAKNRLEGVPLEWRAIPLKRVPEQEKQKKWKQKWNPSGICSWPPEDKRIESLNTHIRDAARALIGEGLAVSEKFTSSIKDGLDIRETVRNWHTGDLYVKELPPSRGSIDTVVVLFDSPADPSKYSFQTTWYAEHEEESTLSFYATPIGEKFVGPGIAQCVYGGCAFIFPPRFIPDIWINPRFRKLKTLEDRLLAGAFYHSVQKNVAVVSASPPTSAWKWLARKHKKKIVHIPLSRFSQQMLDRLRVFHVLNGKSIRSAAARYIRDL